MASASPKINVQADAAACIAPDADCGPPLDLVHLSRQTMGDEALERELLGLFDKQAALVLARLSEGDATGGASMWRADLAHTLKGSARSVGAGRVAAFADDYEAAARQGKTPGLAPLAAAVAEVRAVIAELIGA